MKPSFFNFFLVISTFLPKFIIYFAKLEYFCIVLQSVHLERYLKKQPNY